MWLTGEAGFGKTTAAAHRLAALAQARDLAFRALVVVPTSGLAHKWQRAVSTLGIGPCVEIPTSIRPVSWPNRPEVARALYVAVTRAVRGVWLGAAGDWSPHRRLSPDRRRP